MLRAAFRASLQPRPLARCSARYSALGVFRNTCFGYQKAQLFSTTAQRNAPRYVRFSPNPNAPFDYNNWDFGTKVVVGLVGLGGVYYVAHLEQVPETGRWRFMDISPKYEAKLAEASRNQILSTFQGSILPPDHYLTAHVRRVVERILTASDLGTLKPLRPVPPRSMFSQGPVVLQNSDDVWDPDSQHVSTSTSHHDAPPPGAPVGTPREWTVFVVNDKKMINAMAGPGNVVVFTGILPVCQDEAGLAAVLSHEIGHVVARHIPESYSSKKILLGLALLLESLGLDFGVSRLVTALLFSLPNSRTHEHEADAIGLQMMAKACYDPKAAPEMFSRLSKVEKATGGSRVEFLSTHPTSENRVKYLQQRLPDAYSILAASPDCSKIGDALEAFRGFNAFGGDGRIPPAEHEVRW